MAATAEEGVCSSCKKPQSQLSETLKSCARCKRARYCSRECQKNDWKSHKPTCASGASSSSSSQAQYTIPKPFTALQNGTWLHGRPEQDVYQLLIDTYRMRREDKYKFEGDVDEGCIYAGGTPASGLRIFRQFLERAVSLDAARAKDKKLLPSWWSPESVEKCMEMATKNEDAKIGYAVEKHDIQDYYKQNNMPMQLRLFGEALDGTLIGGQSGLMMLQMQAAMEAGSGVGTTLSVNM